MSDYHRFTVKWHFSCRGRGRGAMWGWIVFDRGRPITIPFEGFEEAVQHRDNIQRLYLRWGW